jgi:hypothetical protein
MFMVFIQLIIAQQFCEAQNNMWTWVYGNNPYQQPPDSIQKPGNIFGGAAWIDNAGKFWLFYNNLWKWDGSNWNFVKGDHGKGDYGFLGIPASTNFPPVRSGCITWKDYSGNIWLYGGGDGINQTFNDLWKWDGTYWTWIGTNSYSQYGIKGVANPKNWPMPLDAPSNWIDSKGNFWLFGGIITYFRGYPKFSNDLWKWDGVNWTWINGTGDSVTTKRIYGTKGISDKINMPERRFGCASWIDKNDNLYFFGGAVNNVSGIIGTELCQNDLWKWDGKSWSWLGGSQWDNTETYNNRYIGYSNIYIGGNLGKYGIKGVPDTANWPPPRVYSAFWTDQDGNFWLFGGQTQNNLYKGIYLNDLWKWDGQFWTWISGDSIPSKGDYGTKGISDIKNQPASRSRSFHWLDTNGNLWLYGGLKMDSSFTLNDMWVFNNGKGIPTAINNPITPINTGQIILLNNPTRNNQLSFILDKYYIKLNWEIFDLNGRPIQEGVFRMLSKGSRISATIKSLTPGTYLVKLTGDDKSVQTKKWIRF